MRLFRKGRRYDGLVCQAQHPRHGWGYYAVQRNAPNFRRPLRWVDDAPGDPQDGSGHFEEV